MMQVEFDDSSSRDGDDELVVLQIKPPQTSSEVISVLNNKNEKKKRHSKESNRRHHHHHHHHHHHKYDTLKTSNADSSYKAPDMENKLLHYRDNKSKDLNSDHEKNITGEDMNMNDRRSKKPTKDTDSDKEKNIKYEITNVRQIKLVKNIKESRKYNYGTEEKSTHFLEKMKLEWRNKRLQYLEHQRNKDPSLCTEKEDLQDNYCEKETSKHSENIHIENSGNENNSIENLKIENERYCTLVSLVSSEDESMDYNEETANDELSDSKTENVCNLEDNVEISDHNSSDDNSTGNKTAEENLENGSINENEKVELFKKNSFVETTKETIVSNKKENINRNSKEENEVPSVSGEKCPLQATTKHTPKLPVYCPAIQGCRSIDGFHVLNRIEEGTYGVVYRARDKETKEIVALKRLKMEREKEGFPITSLREINTLLKAQHPNIVTVREIVVGSNMDRIYIVMDYVEHDLKSLMKTMPRPFLIGEVKTLLMQLLCAVAHLHDNWILHRDLKTSNLLLSHQGILKVGDFGLAREYGSPLKSYTPVVVTLWYRAPELLLGAKKYSTPIDMWSVGCIFGELLTKNALFPGKSESDQINRIFKDLGTPSENIWPGYNQLPLVQSLNITQYPYNNLKSRFSHTFTDVGFDLLNKFLTYNPARRISAEKAKTHEFFNEKPRPVPPNMFPTWPARSEQEYRTARSSPKPPLGGINYSRH